MGILSPKLSLSKWKFSSQFLVLLLALLHGLLWVFLAPPWQHYDEPGHFEYAWLIANRTGLPEPGASDQSMRREVLASMVEHGFFRDMEMQPDLIGGEQGVDIGIPQTADQPAYYWLTALPLRLVRGADVTFQMYLARLVSLLLYLITVGAALGTVALLFPPGHPVRWMAPTTLAVLPGFVDLMTAVNNDVGAVAFFSLFVLSSLYLLRNGLNPISLGAVIATAILSAWTKLTAGPALALAPLVVLFTALRTHKRLALGITVGLVAALLPVVFGWGDAAGWTKLKGHMPTSSVPNERAPLGGRAFRLVSGPGDEPTELAQFLSTSQMDALRGKTVTIGAWIWSSQPIQVRSPILYKNGRAFFLTVDATTEPQFFSFEESIGLNAKQLGFSLAPFFQPPETTTRVFYDGLLLIAGSRPLDSVPRFNEPEAESVTLAGESFRNLLRNPSAEESWPYFRSWAEDAILRFFPAPAPILLTTMLDPQRADWYIRSTMKTLFRTFWAQFGWGHVSLNQVLSMQPYRVLLVLTLLAIVGVIVYLIRCRSRLSWETAAFLALVLVIVWVAAMLRGVASLVGTVFIPSARYAFPAIIPTVLVLTTGWLEWARLGEGRLRLPAWTITAAFWVFFLTLDALSIFTLVKYYY